ncbi:MAG: hypothetical protein WCC90_20675 [Methylocella sp.]|jgi:hypothetical protein
MATIELSQEEIDHIIELLEERQEFEPEEDTLYTRLIARLEALVDPSWPGEVPAAESK